MQFSKIFLSETTRHKDIIFSIYHHLDVAFLSCSNFAPRVEIEFGPGSHFHIELNWPAGHNFTLN